jgi:chemotaxis protein methyltransferase CheR
MTQRLALSDAHFRRICQLIYQRAGIVLADHKRDMVYNRLVRRLRTLGLDDFGRYLSMLEANQNSAEWQAFINSLTTNLTAFFREGHHFPVLADHARAVVPGSIASGVRQPQPVKSRTRWRSRWPIRWGWRRALESVASDIDTEVLEKARNGVYRQDELKTLSPQQLQRYFMRGTGPHEGLVRAPGTGELRGFHQLTCWISSTTFRGR